MQFNNPYFIFDGIKSKDKNITIISIGETQKEKQFGINRNMEFEEGLNGLQILKSIKLENLTVRLTLMKVNYMGIPMAYNRNELDDICRWLFQDEFKPFISYDCTSVVSYVIFTKGKNFKNAANEGYLNVEMKLSAPYAYSNQMIDYVHVSNQKDIIIINNSNVQRFVYPDIEFKLGNSIDLEIINMTLGESMKFTGLSKDEHVYCYNDGLKYLESKVDKTRILYENFNKKWLRLSYGKNRIRIKGDCQIKIITQCPIALN